jgi:hypothetical protein
MSTSKRLSLALGSLLICSSTVALADNDSRVVDCSRGQSIQDALGKKHPDRPLTVTVRGNCMENVTVTRDDVTLVGEGGAVHGTISIVGARRVLIRTLTISSPTGNGIFGTENAAFRVEDCTLERNFTNGILVRNGAQVTVRGGSLSMNGHATTAPDTGRGIEATHNGSIDVQNATISGNRSDGVGVFNNSYARLVENTIEGNGRQPAGEGGVQVSRSRVRANGNVIRNNTGSAGIVLVNDGNYRTGSSLNVLDFPDNEFAFERIEQDVAGGRLAVDVNNSSYGDLRQVHIVGSINVGRSSMLQVRGDDVGPNLVCSTITVPAGGGPIQIGRNGHLRLLFVNVTPPAFNIASQNGQLDGSAACVVAPAP